MKKVLWIIIPTMILLTGLSFWLIKGKNSGDEHPAISHPEVAGKRIVACFELFEPKKAFNFILTDQEGRRVSLEDFKGKVTLIGFIYTSCLDVCGLLTMSFKTIQNEFEEIIDKDLSLILIINYNRPRKG